MSAVLRIDLREPYRVRIAPIPDAENIPLATLLAEPERLAGRGRVVFVSDDAKAAAFATRHFRAMGYDAVAP